jgi:hypothetical protein
MLRHFLWSLIIGHCNYLQIKTALTFLWWKSTTDEQELNTSQLITCDKTMEDRKRH